MAFNTAMRKGELLNLQWSPIDRKKDSVRLPGELTKEKRAKNIPVNHHLKDVLDGLPRALHHDYVFTFKKKTMRRELRIGMKDSCENAGILYGRKVAGGFCFHDMRITFKTNMLRAGVDKALGDVLVGHRLKGMDAYYLKPTDDDLRCKMDKFTSGLDEVFSASVDQSVDHEAAG